jgi:hypothetical protein
MDVIGRTNWNSAPFLPPENAVSSPPWRSIIARQMASPNPIPGRNRRLAQDRNERQIRRSQQFTEVKVAELVRKRMASPNEFAEPGAQRFKAGFVGHRCSTRLFQASQRLRRL